MATIQECKLRHRRHRFEMLWLQVTPVTEGDAGNPVGGLAVIGCPFGAGGRNLFEHSVRRDMENSVGSFVQRIENRIGGRADQWHNGPSAFLELVDDPASFSLGAVE